MPVAQARRLIYTYEIIMKKQTENKISITKTSIRKCLLTKLFDTLLHID